MPRWSPPAPRAPIRADPRRRPNGTAPRAPAGYPAAEAPAARPRAALIRNSVDVVDAVDGTHGAQHVAQVLGVAHLEGELAHRHPVPGGGDGRGQDVDVLVGDGTGDVGQQPGPVEGLHLYPDEEQ